MIPTRYEKLLARYRMMISAGGMLEDIAAETDAQLLKRLKHARNHEEQMQRMAELTSLVPETFWQSRGL